jgi:hypothetical protein
MSAKENARATARRGFELMHIRGLSTRDVGQVFGMDESQIVKLMSGYPEERQAVLRGIKEGQVA